MLIVRQFQKFPMLKFKNGHDGEIYTLDIHEYYKTKSKSIVDNCLFSTAYSAFRYALERTSNPCDAAHICQPLHDRRRKYFDATTNTWAFIADHDNAVRALGTRSFNRSKSAQSAGSLKKDGQIIDTDKF